MLQPQSPSARKVWIEILCSHRHTTRTQSPSARKVWIEIRILRSLCVADKRHLPRGRCGLKCPEINIKVTDNGHLPRGRCGLKSEPLLAALSRSSSPSARKVWIEIRLID